MSSYVVLKPFEGQAGHKYASGDRVDHDEFNGWLHGQKLVGMKYLAPAPAAKRGRKPKGG